MDREVSTINILEYIYFVSIHFFGETKEVGTIIAKHKEMPFKPKCYGIYGMRQVVVFPLSMEILE